MTPFFSVMDRSIQYIGLVAFFLSACLIILNAARDVYAVDPQAHRIPTPIGGTTDGPRWRLMSDYAQDCRSELKLLAYLFRFAITTMLMILVASFFVEPIAAGLASSSFLPQPLHAIIVKLHSVMSQDNVLHFGLGGIIFVTGSFVIWSLSFVVYDVILAQENCDMNKSPPLAPGEDEPAAARADSQNKDTPPIDPGAAQFPEPTA